MKMLYIAEWLKWWDPRKSVSDITKCTHTGLFQNDLAYLLLSRLVSIRTFHLQIPQFQDASRELIMLMVPQCWHQRKLTNSKNEVHIYCWIACLVNYSIVIGKCYTSHNIWNCETHIIIVNWHNFRRVGASMLVPT